MKVKPTGHSGEVALEMNRRDEPLLTAASTAPFRLRQILVPIDFSICSKKALQYAVPFAEQHGAAITLVYVVSSAAYPAGEFGGMEYASLEADMLASGQKDLDALAQAAIRGAVQPTTIVRAGAPAFVIVDLAKSIPADMIVISTHGHTGLKHLLLGSVAERVVRDAPCPVLVVREREHEFLAS